MRFALPPPQETHLPPGATQGYAVRCGTVIVCREGRIDLELPALGLGEVGQAPRVTLRQGESCVIEDAGWLRCHASGAARMLRLDPPVRRAWPGLFLARLGRVILRSTRRPASPH